jgi:hypothetical protein
MTSAAPAAAGAPAAPVPGVAAPAPRPRPSSGALPKVLLAAAALLFLLLVAGGGLWWFLRGRTSGTSKSTAVPSPAPTVVALPRTNMVVLASPWGEVTRIQAEDGHELPLPTRRDTPLVLSVPTGRYVVTLTNPGAPAPATCTVVAAAGQPATCKAQILPVEPLQYFKEAGWWR